ncbi:ABC transporter ATP-binding protein [Cellulomonas sp. S1-8]|uniref:ABC transporter ATP-binding protein n=1 Tax=Cellulomonas sp. S1-8 TaxID=2904790 RepID=UPI0022448EAC|nr:ABC transporter ATP-binding protein [Cellulomonas sp. S1-8]UZN05139.1 ABC transporter ATP-binding protein [Cellulomonas sp. S1-8]
MTTPPGGLRGPDGALVRLSGVRRAFGDEVAVDGLDLTVRAGEIHAVVGLNGAGKSTLMRLALGMLRPDAGTAHLRTVDGTEVPAWRAPAAAWARVGHLVEAPFAYAELTVTEMVVAAARLRGLSRTDAPPAARRAVHALGLAHWERRRTRTLSSGNRQRLGLACAAVHRPHLLILDEPSTALDPAGVVLVRTWLQRTRDDGAGVLVSSHHLDEVARVADRITVVHRGRAVGALAPDGVDLERQFFTMVHATEESAPTPGAGAGGSR